MMHSYYNNGNSDWDAQLTWMNFNQKVTTQEWNQYLDYLINSGFHGVKSLFVWLYESNLHQTIYTRSFFQI